MSKTALGHGGRSGTGLAEQGPGLHEEPSHIYEPREAIDMGLGTDLLNGIVSLVISVGVTVAMADDDGPYDMTDVVLSVAVSAFLSGFFTSYFAGE